jgi:hypothetical protein
LQWGLVSKDVEFGGGRSMRNLLAFFGAAIIVLLGLGYYLGWYSITQQKTDPGQTRIQVDIHKEKIGQDVHKTAEKIEDAIDKNKQNTPNSDGKPSAGGNAPAAPAGDGSTSSTQPSKSSKVRDDIGNLVIDGWDSGAKK